MLSLNCKGHIVSLESPVVMGILNATPDSFYQRFSSLERDKILFAAEKMIKEGAVILDIGGQSTRPESKRLKVHEELERVIPVIHSIHNAFPDTILSIDTYFAEIAKEAVGIGVSIVNDISAGMMDENMISTVADLKVPYICMHMKGTPENMQHAPAYDNIIDEMMSFFANRIKVCNKAGIKDIVIDPGFGFGKTISNNYQLINNLNAFSSYKLPILVGLSRKSMVYKVLETDANNALNGTSILNTIALLNGANILRVHDVKEAMETIKLINIYKKNRY
jgi:dihydropteroate synthase